LLVWFWAATAPLVDYCATYPSNCMKREADALCVCYGNAVLSPCSDRTGAIDDIAVAFGRH